MPVFIKVEGFQPGEGTKEGYEQWIEVETVGWGVADRNQKTPADRRDQEVSGVAIERFVISKMPDPSTAEFLDKCVNGDHIPKVEIVLVKREKNKTKRVREWVLEAVKVADVSTHMSAQGGSSDVVSLSFAKINWAMYGPDGAVKARGGYDATKY